MIQEYIDDMKSDYVDLYVSRHAPAREPIRQIVDKAERKFDAFISTIRSDAWDEGFTEGRDLAVSGQPMTRHNPYKEQKQ